MQSPVTIVLAALILLRATPRFRVPIVLAIGVAAVPIGVIVATCAGSLAPRTRVSVSFIGYRVPLALLSDCSAPVKLWTKGGVWIGGGARSENDPTPDIVVIPGFRPHLLQICSQGTPLLAQKFSVRTIEPGRELVESGNRLLLQAPIDPPTQRVALDPVSGAMRSPRWAKGRCLDVGQRRIPVTARTGRPCCRSIQLSATAAATRASLVRDAPMVVRKDVRHQPPFPPPQRTSHV